MGKIALAAVIVALSVGQAEASFYRHGIAYSNICRADENPMFFWAFPRFEPVGTDFWFPNGTPCTFSWS
jgi:hypothetical protein